MSNKTIMEQNITQEQALSEPDRDNNNNNFIKPTLSKIALLLLLSPILLFSFFVSSCALGFFDCNPGHTSEDLMIIPFIIILIEIVILYLISCSIVYGWNWIFSSFHEKNKDYNTIALLLAIIFILIIFYVVSKIFGYV